MEERLQGLLLKLWLGGSEIRAGHLHQGLGKALQRERAKEDLQGLLLCREDPSQLWFSAEGLHLMWNPVWPEGAALARQPNSSGHTITTPGGKWQKE